MTGAHFEQISLFDGRKPDQLALSILRDLCEENADLLTVSEATYLFHLVKVHTLNEDITAHYICPHCKKEGTYKIDLSTGKLNLPPSDFKCPTIAWKLNADAPERTYKVMPVPLAQTIAIQNWFMQVKDINVLAKDTPKEERYQYGLIQTVSSLVRDDDSHILDISNYDTVSDMIKANSFRTMAELISKEKEVNSYGPTLSPITTTCKECGKDATFRIPLFLGLTC